MSDTTPFLQLQTDLAAHITGGAYLSDIPVLTEAKADLNSEIDQALAGGGVKGNGSGKAGLAITVVTPDAKSAAAGGDDVVVLALTMRVTLAVNPLVNNSANGIQKQPLAVLWKLISRIHGWRRHDDAEPVELQSYEANEIDGNLYYTADFRLTIALQLDAEPEPEPETP